MNLDYRLDKDVDFLHFNDKLDILKINQEKLIVNEKGVDVQRPFHRLSNIKKEYTLSIVFANGNIVELEDSWYVDSAKNSRGFISYESILFDYYNNRVLVKKGIDDNISQQSQDLDTFLNKTPQSGTKTYNFSDYSSTCTYNQGKLIENRRVYKDGHTEILTYEYNSLGKIAKIYNNIGGIKYVDTAYEYDSKGNEIFVQWIHNYHTMETRHGLTRYDDYGNIIFEDNYYNGKRTIKRIYYKYDNHYNWIERRTVVNDILEEIDIREMIYLY